MKTLKMRVGKQAVIAGILAVMTSALLSGCVHKGPILVDFGYEAPPSQAIPAGKTVAVSPFRDDRGKKDSVVGRRFGSVGEEVNDLVVQGTVSDTVTHALKASLAAHGLNAESAPAWDLTEADIPSNGPKLIIGGEIRSLWLETLADFGNTKVTAKVDIRVVLADREQKKIIRALNVSSSIQRSAVAYSKGLIQNTLSEALTAALNQIYQDEELKQNL